MRIRSIKPEFWRSADVAALTVEDRLLFIGLWSYVDDNGVGRDELHAILGDLFASDMVASPRETVARVQRGLERLEALALITRYRADGKPFLAVTAWKKHQKIDRPSPGRYPGPDQAEPFDSTSPREDASSPRGVLDAGTEEQRNRGTEVTTPPELRSEAGNALALIPSSKPPAGKRKKYPAEFETFWTVYPRHEDKAEAFKAWNAATRSTSPDEITAGAERYRHDPNRDDQYTKHAATWLRAGSWENGPLPQRRPETQQARLEASSRETLATLHRMGVA